MRLKNSILISISVLLISSCSYYPEEFERSSSNNIEETHKYIKIGSNGSKALIFYPGGLVDPFAYVGMLSRIVEEDINIFIPKVPYNLAILNIKNAEEIKSAFPEIVEWSIGGHSLGGTVACFVLADDLKSYKNLFLLASYPANNVDLKTYDGTVVSLYGSMDGVLNIEELNNSKSKFQNVVEVSKIEDVNVQPGTSYFYGINGGNHSNFGNYGFQKGDNASSISKNDQQVLVTSIISKILRE